MTSVHMVVDFKCPHNIWDFVTFVMDAWTHGISMWPNNISGDPTPLLIDIVLVSFAETIFLDMCMNVFKNYMQIY